MNLIRAKNILLSNPKVKSVLSQKDLDTLKIETGLQILELRLIRNKTQAQLAKLIGTKQPSIARAERGAILPSLAFLHKIADALKTELIPPKFAAVEENQILAEIRSKVPPQEKCVVYREDMPYSTESAELVFA